MKPRTKLQCQLASKMPPGTYDWSWLASRAFDVLNKSDPGARLEQQVLDTLEFQLGPTASSHEMIGGLAAWKEAWILALKEATRWRRNIGRPTSVGAQLIAILLR